jgi:hypothetical protein
MIRLRFIYPSSDRTEHEDCSKICETSDLRTEAVSISAEIAPRSGNRRGRTLANSNQRSWKGFRPTYRMERTYFIAGTYKLDWLFVKNGPRSRSTVACQPRNPKTLRHFNEVGGMRLSDHHPLTVDIECLSGVSDPPRESAMRPTCD